MANIKINVAKEIYDGMLVSFRAPCDCNEVNGLSVTYQVYSETSATPTTKTFVFKDAHGNNLTGLGNLFFEGALVQVMLDVTNSGAFIMNADSNGYIDAALDGKSNTGHTHSASDVTSGTLPVARGGTGKATHTANAVLTGNTTSAVKNVATANGAFYATAANGAAKFGTLPVAQGGTGATSAANARTNLGAKMKLLWTNASPTSTFESFTPLANADLAESLANFTAIMIWFNITPDMTQHAPFIIPIGVGSGTSTDDVKNATLCFTTGDNKWVRRYCWATTSAVTFGAGGYKTSLSANWTVNSKYMVPERIYGIR